MSKALKYNILDDDLSAFAGKEPAFVSFGETMIRDTPADMQRAERTRQIDISLSGSEHILSVGLSRLKQTLMFDLGIVTRQEVQAVMEADVTGGGKRTAR